MNTKLRQAYDEATQAHNIACQRRRYAASEFRSGRMSKEDFIKVSDAEKAALQAWEDARLACYGQGV